MAKGKQKFIQYSDIIMIIFFGLGLLAFIMLGFLGGQPTYPPQKFIDNVQNMQQQLAQVAEDAEDPVIENYARNLKKRIENTQLETKSGLNIANSVLSAKSAYVKPALELDVPRHDVKIYPVSKDSLKAVGKKGTITLTWAPAVNDECKYYKISWWMKSSFTEEEDYSDREIRNSKVPAGSSGEKEVGFKKSEYLIENVTDNIHYVIEIVSMDINYTEIAYPEEQENAWVMGVSVGQEKDMPLPQNLRVVRASLAGVQLMWDPPEYCFEPDKTYPERSYFSVLLYRWIAGEEANKVLLTPATKASPYGVMITEFVDGDIQPGKEMLYGIRFYHYEDYPDNKRDDIRYLGEEITIDKFMKMKRTGQPDFDPKTKEPRFEPKKVYASKMIQLDQPVVLENKPVLELMSITSNENPDNPNSNARIEVTTYTKLPDVDDPSVEKYVRCKVKVSVGYGDMIAGNEKPIEINGVKFNDSPYAKMRNLKIKFATDYKIVGLYSITYNYNAGHIYTLKYAEVKNVDSRFKNSWPFKLYRIKDIADEKAARAELSSNGLKKKGLIPDVELDRQRGFNEEERIELFKKLKNYIQSHNELSKWGKRQPWAFSKKLEDLLFEFSIENEIRFYPSSIIRDFEILKDNDQFMRLLKEAKKKNW